MTFACNPLPYGDMYKILWFFPENIIKSNMKMPCIDCTHWRCLVYVIQIPYLCVSNLDYQNYNKVSLVHCDPGEYKEMGYLCFGKFELSERLIVEASLHNLS